MQHLESVVTECPYCGEQIELLVDCSIADQEYVEDCSVCCRPIVIVAGVAEDDTLNVDVRTEND
jgi:hypothetical protein